MTRAASPEHRPESATTKRRAVPERSAFADPTRPVEVPSYVQLAAVIRNPKSILGSLTNEQLARALSIDVDEINGDPNDI